MITTAAAVSLLGAGAVGGFPNAALAADPDAPVIDTSRPAYAHVGDAYEAQLEGHDPQGQTITWSSANLPAGLTVSASGLITGVPTAKNLYKVDVVATDPDGNSATKQLYLVVKGAPAFIGDPPGPQTWHLNRPVSLVEDITDGVDVVDDEPEVMTVEVTGLPAGLTSTIQRTGSTNTIFAVTVSGTPTTVSSGTMVYTAVDPDGDRLTVPVPWTVGAPPPPTQPIGVTVTGGNGTATVKWNGTFPDSNGTEVSGWVVRANPGTSQTLPASARSVTLTGFDVTRYYQIGVRATSADGGEGPEEIIFVTPTELTLSPATLIAGYANPVDFSGQIDGLGPVAGTEAALEQKPAGATTWTRVTTVKTNRDGWWHHTVNPTVNTQYRVVYAGGDKMWAATSAIATITVRYAVTVTPSTTSTTVNTPVTFKGTIRPATPGVVAYLQRLTNGEWVTIQSTTQTAGGAYSISRGFPRGTWSLRMYASGGGSNGYGFTSAIRLTVS
ncbi:hypothetical protein KOI35_28465 [Actinoplanes bogorensis]|uniref:Fibronectin type-III domain-containing protein n=1 Tax=Paractinoplanes bogorensis TaxID=1610840 RepID=A0ABS5YVH5_9ACTN|nr:hypothetical protein [Actinoplanes bogorensis]MBU2667452.1 hypothetical protein [Actinoplanes bogorensis]